MEKVIITVKETAELVGVSTQTIYTMVKENQIPYKRVRTRIVFHREKLLAWMAQ